MSERAQWTNEQWDAITERDCNLLVAAAAGAGKTAVLVERIIRKITDEKNPVDIDRLLVVTFTNAAATEMRERIAEAISQVLEKNPDSRLIQRQLALLGKASITTIHSFCMEVIRSNFQALNIDPNFRIADDAESSLMKLEALNELFEEQYEKEDNTGFLELLECYGGNRDDQTLMDMVLGLYEFIQSSPWPENWLYEMTERLNVPDGTDFGITQWGRVLLSSVQIELEGLKEMLKRAIRLVRTGAGLEKYLPVFHEDLANIEGLMKLISTPQALSDAANDSPHPSNSVWDRLFNALQALEFSTLPRCGKEVDKEKQETVKKIRDEVKSGIGKIREKLIIAESNAVLLDLKGLYPKIKCLADLVVGLTRKYSEKKSRKSVVDFNDLEHFCLEILAEKCEDGKLRPSPIALGYRERFAEILVDEYQDSNMVQEIMIAMISKADSEKPNVFMVGDVKQSIYRFRQARPELFLHKYHTYSAEKGNAFRKILLFKNFRSRKEVVDAVNFLFKQMMSVNVGELDYTDTEALNPGAAFMENNREDAFAGGEAELHLIRTGSRSESSSAEEADEARDSGDSNAEEEEILDNIQCEARLVARRIHELTSPDDLGRVFCIFDKGRKEYRRAEFRDIVILLRTTKNWSEVFAQELALLGIPAYADTGSGFFKTIEVQIILSLLQIIDNPLQDIPLLSVLRSPIAGFTTDELAELRLKDFKAPLFEALKILAEKAQGELKRKTEDFLAKLQKWREMSLYLSTDKLIWRLYDETGYYGMVGAMPAGEQRQANLRILYERARQFEETSYKGLFNFICFVDRLRGSKGDMGSAKILSENDNVVRIMSIHKSKGLEFPVVFLSGCGKKFNLQDMNKSILLHQDLGFGPDVVDHRLRLSWASAAKLSIREKIKTETLSEEMRILYVALTRAREKLIITGSVNDAEMALAKWLNTASIDGMRLPDYEMLKGANYLDWIVPALLRHPDCAGLYESAPAGTEGSCIKISDPSRWHAKVWEKSCVLNANLQEEGRESEFLAWLDSLCAKMDKGAKEQHAQTAMDEALQDAAPTLHSEKEIDRRLGWEYGFGKAATIPAKFSVTELKRRFNLQSPENGGEAQIFLPGLVKKPLFLEGKKGLNAAEKGTILHFVLQHLDFSPIKAICQSRPDSLAFEISAQIETMAAKDLLTRQQADSVEIDRICRFFNSSLGRRMLDSNSLNREIPFTMQIPCCELYKEHGAPFLRDETVLLQGVIDCYFEEPDGVVLVDYKTDHVPAGGPEIIQERYRHQISYYAKALEMLSGRRVKGEYIYLFWNGEILDMKSC